MNIKYRVYYFLLDKSTLHKNKKSITTKYKLSNYLINVKFTLVDFKDFFPIIQFFKQTVVA